MPDYRGGDNASFSPHAAQAISNINSGNTPGARARELRNKAILAGTQAFLMGAAGATSGVMEKRESGLKAQDAINNAKLRISKMKPSEPGGYEGIPMAGTGEGPGMRGHESFPMGDVPFTDQYGHPQLEDIGKSGLARDDVNKSAAGAPVTWGGQGHFTPAGLGDMSQNSAIQGEDIKRARDIVDMNTAPTPFVDLNAGPETSLSPRDASGSIIRRGMQ